jgi:hypothetical protein
MIDDPYRDVELVELYDLDSPGGEDHAYYRALADAIDAVDRRPGLRHWVADSVAGQARTNRQPQPGLPRGEHWTAEATYGERVKPEFFRQ